MFDNFGKDLALYICMYNIYIYTSHIHIYTLSLSNALPWHDLFNFLTKEQWAFWTVHPCLRACSEHLGIQILIVDIHRHDWWFRHVGLSHGNDDIALLVQRMNTAKVETHWINSICTWFFLRYPLFVALPDSCFCCSSGVLFTEYASYSEDNRLHSFCFKPHFLRQCITCDQLTLISTCTC